MAKADHIYVSTKWLGITHHGIDMGDGSVIHFFRDPEQVSLFDDNPLDEPPLVISRTHMDDFRNGREESIIQYRYCLPDDEVIATAEFFFRRQLADGLREFNLREFNCEHFATLCKVGREKSRQAENADRLQSAGIILWALVESLPF